MRERERREVLLQGGMKPTSVFRTHFGMRAPADLAGSVLFSAIGSARWINRAGAAAAAASVRLSAAGCLIAVTKEGEEGLAGWLLAAEADEGALVVVGSAEPCWKESANRANTRRGSETRKRKHIISKGGRFPEELVVFGGLA